MTKGTSFLLLVWIGHEEDIFYGDSGETLEDVSQRSCGYAIIESFQGQVGWDIDLVGT